MREYLDLFWAFIVVGATAFGGGYAVVPVLERELVKKRGWITMDEVLDFYTIAQIRRGSSSSTYRPLSAASARAYSAEFVPPLAW